MNKLITLPLLTSAALMSAAVFAAEPGGPMPFTTATFTEVVNDVQLIPAGSTQGAKAAVKTVFNAPDLVKTGRKSRAQLTAADGTIARVGSNAVFAFDKDTRTVNLERGSILFHSPTGKGGGAIVTNSATASVIGTTIIVTATSDGGFKMFVLEGVAKVKFPDGKLLSINPGQMTFVMPGSTVSGGGKGGQAGPVLNFDLGAMTQDSLLIEGFGSALPSLGKIKSEVNNQNELIADGDLVRTGLFILGAGSGEEFFLTNQDAVQQAVQASNLALDSEAQRLSDALAGSFTYTGGPLPENFVFRTPVNISPFGSVAGFVAGQLILNAPGLDLSSLDGLPQVDVVGASTSSLDILGDLDITGLDATRTLRLQGGAIHIADNAHVKVLFANAPTVPASVDFISFSPIVFNGVTLEAPGASLGLKSMSGDLTLTGGELISGAQLTVYSAGAMNLLSGVMGEGESVSLFSVGDATLSGAKFKALSGDLDLLSSGALTLDGNAQLSGATGLTLFSGTNLNVTNAQFDSPSGDIDISASGTVNFAGLAATAANNLGVDGAGAVSVSGGSLTATTGTLTINGATLVMSGNGTLTAGGTVILGGDTVGVTDFAINSPALTLGGRSGATATRIDLNNVNTSALTVNLSAQTLVLNGVGFANNSSVVMYSQNGLLNLTGINLGSVNFTGLVTWNGLDAADSRNNLIYAPASGLGDASYPIHILPFGFTGSGTDFAKTNDLLVDTDFSTIPPLHKVLPTYDLQSTTGFDEYQPGLVLSLTDLVGFTGTSLPDINPGQPDAHSALAVNGLLARNITVTGGTIDLTPFEPPVGSNAIPHVDIVAAGTLSWTGSLGITGQSQNRILEIRATDWVVASGASYSNSLAPDSDFAGDVSKVSFVSVNDLNLPSVNITQLPGSLNVYALAGDITLDSSILNAGDGVNGVSGSVRVLASGDITVTNGSVLTSEQTLVRLNSGGTITATNSTLEAMNTSNTPFPQGEIVVRAAALVSITGGTLRGTYIDIGGPSTVPYDPLSNDPDAIGTGSDLTKIMLDGVVFATSGAPGINIAARTVVLSNIDFPSGTSVRLRSENGALNINGNGGNGLPMALAVNFMSGVTVGGASIMGESGINSKVWVEGGAGNIYFNGGLKTGTPIQDATGTALSSDANIHIQTLNSPKVPTAQESLIL